MTEYPLVFTLKDTVAGTGFLAGVTMNGRSLMVPEDGGWWMMMGVRPAAMAAGGESPAEARIKFREAFLAVLFEMSALAPDFESFKLELERFFQERDEAEELRWREAGEAIREGRVKPESPFSELPRASPDTHPVSLSVERLDKAQAFTASDNVLESVALSPTA
jgi:hypothetical protein